MFRRSLKICFSPRPGGIQNFQCQSFFDYEYPSYSLYYRFLTSNFLAKYFTPRYFWEASLLDFILYPQCFITLSLSLERYILIIHAHNAPLILSNTRRYLLYSVVTILSITFPLAKTLYYYQFGVSITWILFLCYTSLVKFWHRKQKKNKTLLRLNATVANKAEKIEKKKSFHTQENFSNWAEFLSTFRNTNCPR